MKNRSALVIGNSNYVNVSKLNNPKNDANDIESVLHKLDFDVTKILDARLIDIQYAVNIFLKNLDEYAVGLLFYAGHGMQIDGKNYIVPVDSELSNKSKTIVSCYCLNSFLDSVSSYKGKTIICILDACRNNPFVIDRGILTGFAPFSNPPKGTIIAYSTSADCTAFDGQGSNGLYTQVLKDAMLIPNLKIEDMFKSVRNKVTEISIREYGEEQLSWEYSSLIGDFYFSVTPQPVNVHISDDEIYKFIKIRRKAYENTSDDIYDIECMPFVDAYNKYQIPIIKILRAYSRILPLPEELKPKKPIEGQELKIKASLSSELKEGKIRFFVSSNIPKETPMIFTLSGKNYEAQCKGVVSDDGLISEWFSDKGTPIRTGFYIINISAPIYNVLPDAVKRIFGERNRNICGRYVKFDPIGGNMISFSYGLLVRGNTVQVIDMQQRISEL